MLCISVGLQKNGSVPFGELREVLQRIFMTITIFNILGSYSLLALLAYFYVRGTNREREERHKQVMKDLADNMKKLDEYRKRFQI